MGYRQRNLHRAFIWVDANKMNIIQGKNGRLTTRDKFKVEKIVYDDKGICGLSIQNQKTSEYLFGKKMRRCYICGSTQGMERHHKNWKEDCMNNVTLMGRMPCRN